MFYKYKQIEQSVAIIYLLLSSIILIYTFSQKININKNNNVFVEN